MNHLRNNLIKGKLFVKIIILISLLLVFIVSLNNAVSIRRETGILMEGMIEKNKLFILQLSTNVKSAFWSANWYSAERLLKKTVESEEVLYCKVIKPNGEIFIADDKSLYGKKVADTHLLNTRELSVIDIVLPQTGEKGKLIINPIEIGNERWSVWLGISLRPIHRARISMLYSNILWGILILCLGWLIAFWLSRGITRPIAQLVKGTKEISSGNLEYRINIATFDEVGKLANAFNQMTSELKKNRADLEAYSKTLEKRVQERTKELKQEITERKRAQEELRLQNEYLAALNETTLGLISRLELSELLEAIVARAGALVGTPNGYIYLYDPDNGELKERVGLGAFREHVGLTFKPGEGLTGKVWETGQPLVVNDYCTWPDRMSDPRLDNLRALVGIPLKSGSGMVGVIGLGHFGEDKTFGEQEIAILSRFAELASIALDNAQLYTKLQRELGERKRAEEHLYRQKDYLDALQETSLGMINRLDLNELLGAIIERAASLIDAPNGYISLLEPTEKKLEVKVAVGVHRRHIGFRQKPDEGLVGRVFETGRPIVVDDYRCWPSRIQDVRFDDIRSVVGIPLKSGEQVVGAIAVYDSEEGKFGDGEVELLSRFASLASIALENARLYTSVQQELAERKRAEQALRENEEKFRLSFENAKDAILWADSETGLIISCNKAAEILLEKKREEIVGSHQTTLHPPQKAEYFANMFKRHIEQKGTADDEAEVINKSGKIIPVHIAASVTMVGGKRIIQGIFRDITERKRAEEAIRESEERFRLTVEATRDGLWENSYDHKTDFFSDRMFTMLGYEPMDPAKGFDFFNSVRHPDDVKNFEKKYNAINKPDHNDYSVEMRLKAKDGTWRHILSRGKCVEIDEKGKPVRIVGAHTDITDLKRAEEVLQREKQAVQRLAEEREVVAKIGRIIGSTLEIEEVYEYFADEVRKIIPFDRIAINLIHPEMDAYASAYIAGMDVAGHRPGNVVPLAGSLTEEVVRIKSSILIQTEDKDEVVGRFPRLLPNFQAGLRSLIAVPLISKDQVIGVMHIQLVKSKAYTAADVELAENIGAQIAGAIANVQLYEETKRAEGALRASEERFALAVQGTNEGLWDWDIVNNSLYWSPRLKELLGYADDELDPNLDNFLEGVLHPDDRERVRAALDAHLKDRKPYYVEQRQLTKSGEYRWFMVRGKALWDEAGNPIRMVGSTTDITDRKQAEEALRASEERYALAVRGSNDGLWDWDIQNNTLYWSPRLKELLGYADDEIEVSFDTFESILHPEYGKQTEAAIEAHLKDRVPYNVEHRLRTKSGSYRWFYTRGEAVWDDEGQPIRMVGSTTDITELKQTEEKVKDANRRLVKEMREKEEFLRIVSHDLGAPVRNISGMAASIIRKHRENIGDEARDRLARIQRNAEHELGLIQDLLELSRIKTRRERFEEVDLGELVRGVGDGLSHQLEEKGITLEIADGLPAVICERKRMMQVFQNLIDNACKYMDSNKNPRIEVGFEELEGSYRFSVSDNGIGIKEEDQERIFYVFNRLKNSTTSQVEGKGVGLSAVKAVVEAYGGEVWVESPPRGPRKGKKAKGSTFYFTLTKDALRDRDG